MALTTTDRRVKLLYNVQYVPSLAHNLLSIVQLLANGYSVLFVGDTCTIKDSNTRGVVDQHTEN